MYNVVAGDTFELVARKTYGDGSKGPLIASANPGTFEPLVVGSGLFIPTDATAPKDNPPTPTIADVTVAIDRDRFVSWTEISISRSLDNIDQLSFSAPFEPSSDAFRAAFEPMSFKSTAVKVQGVSVFTGVLVDVTPALEEKSNVVTASAYSSPGVLQDCTPPASAYPLEFRDQNLLQITEKLVSPFGIKAVFEGHAGPAFKQVSCDPGRKVLTFLTELSKQRNLVIASEADGSLVFRKVRTSGPPVALLTEGAMPLLKITPAFSAQQYYTHITGLRPAKLGESGDQITEPNPLLHAARGVRPLTFLAQDTDSADLSAAVRAKIGRMFANAAQYTCEVATWYDPSGSLWSPNTLVKITSPRAMIYEPYTFLIRSVQLNKKRDTETATLSLVIPSAFAGEIPERMPWQ